MDTAVTANPVAPDAAPDGLARWEAATLRRTLQRAPERRAEFTTVSGRPVKRLYTAEDVADVDYCRDIGFPGEFPYTRGVQPTMHRGRLWTMRMFAGFGTAEETNSRFRYLLSQGQTGLSTAFDLPTLYGYDTDHEMSEGEFGKCGVAISSLADMEILFDGIPVDQITTSMTINSPAAMIWAMYIVAAEKRGIPMAKLGGTLQNDILKEYHSQKEYIYPPKPSMRLVVDTIEFAARELPKWNSISISGYHIREAGATAAQELAFTLYDGISYVRACLERGLAVDDFAPRLSFFFNAHNDFFEEIAKYRAARRVWATVMRDWFGAHDPASWRCRFHTQTAGVALTAQQPENNVVRVAIQALAAVLGGTNSLHTNSLDEALALPTEKAARIALRTQQIIAHESGVANTIDAFGGSYFVEALTDEMTREAFAYFKQMDDMGGIYAVIDNGFMQREIADSAWRFQQEVDRQERIIVGVNDYVVDEPIDIPILNINPEGYDRHLARLRRVRAERDQRRASEALAALQAGARGDQNLMWPILDCVRAYCTLGEMCDALREVFGVYTETPVL